MKAFRLLRPRSPAETDRALAAHEEAVLKANGIDLLDRMKERVDTPDTVVGLVDVTGLDAIAMGADGDLQIGAGATLAQVAAHPLVQTVAPSLAHAAELAASPQLRHRATVGGNVMQHTRCGYYRHRSFPCLKRGDATCPVRAEGGVQDTAGIFGNDPCASAHPSSLAPVLCSLDALIRVRGEGGVERMPLRSAWSTPRQGVAADLVLPAGAWIEAVDVPAPAAGQRVGYEEVRQKQAFDWALASAAVALRLEGDTIAAASVWLGSLAPHPWRAQAAEITLVGQKPSASIFHSAGIAAVTDATPLEGTRYKLQLTQVVVRRALAQAMEGSK